MLGLRVLNRTGNIYNSPVYSHQRWGQEWIEAQCSMDCDVPTEDAYWIKGGHTCGIHALNRISMINHHIFAWQTTDIFNNQHLIYITTLCEFAGKIVVGENGLRARYARVIGIVDFNTTPEELQMACAHFNVLAYPPEMVDDMVLKSRC